ncbi:hypothetical protein BJY04DRAFT_217529 [Aspergillus karnatakaensis]|uniref:Zn(II)2Cys6 transcription factor domain-containing protein n=1 Tax=Aspergillus karnatakaensis TaxID=1810916 RepID=UPI003CCD7CD8
MVGVPGRSKACVTCLKRKKRCDLEKPFCGTCRKARVECGGYYRPRVFINSTLEDQSQLLIKRKPLAQSQREDRNSSSDDDAAVALPTQLAQTAYQIRYLDLFWRVYLPNGQALPVELTQTALGKWIDAIHDLHISETVLRKSLLALAVSVIGRKENSRYLKEEGGRLYTNALRSLSSALRDPQRATSDAVLGAIRLLGVYETMLGQNNGDMKQIKSWQAHNVGDVALICARSPYSFTSGHAHELFADGRSNLTMSYIRQRKKCFLADLEWKTIPWLLKDKTPRDHLLDMLVDIPGLFENIDLMKACTDSSVQEISRQKILDSFLRIHQDLITWHLLRAPDYEPVSKTPETFSPEQVAGAHLMTTFWATFIIVTSNIRALWTFKSEEGEFEPIFDLDTCCAGIIRTLPLFAHPDLGLFRTHLTTYPMIVAVYYINAAGLDRLVEERKILADCLESPALAGVRQFVSNVKDDGLPAFLS